VEVDRRFPSGFDPCDALVFDAPSTALLRGGFVGARDDDGVIGRGGLRVDDDTAEINRMRVHPRVGYAVRASANGCSPSWSWWSSPSATRG
jgi:hypothetical protein